MTAYHPVRFAAWHVDLGQFELEQDVELVPDQEARRPGSL